MVAALVSGSCGTVLPTVTATSDVPSAGRFPHERLGLVLDKVVSPEGLVDYAALQLEDALLDEYLAELARVSPESHPHLFPTEDDRLAYWINAENACALRDVLRWQRPPRLNPIAHRFDAETFFVVGGKKLSLNDMTNLMRRRFADPRIHFVLVRGRRGGPALAKEPFDAANLQVRLGRAANLAVHDARFVEWNGTSNAVRLANVFFEFRADFEAELASLVSGDARLIAAINHWREPSRKLVAATTVPIPFDDRLNDVANKQRGTRITHRGRLLVSVLCIQATMAGCGERTGNSDAPKIALPSPAAPLTAAVPTAATVPPAAAVAVPAPTPFPLLTLGPLTAGTVMTLVPNLPGVVSDDIPASAERRVEILALDRRRMTLRWTGCVQLERPESARAREDWVRSRSNAGVNATPVPAVAPAYEEKQVTGNLSFPDFGHGKAFLLPGLWPEGTLALKGSSAIWLSAESWGELRKERRTRISFFRAGNLLKDPAAALLERASQIVDEHGSRPKDIWRTLEEPGRVRLNLNGTEGEVATLRVANWFGVYDVLEQEGNLLVLSVLPDPPSSTLLDLFAPAKVLKTLLGYRIASIEIPERKSPERDIPGRGRPARAVSGARP